MKPTELHFYYLIGLICIYMGVRFALRGQRVASKPRIVAGIAIAGVGIAQFFRTIHWLGVSIIAVSLLTFMVSLFMLRADIRRRSE